MKYKILNWLYRKVDRLRVWLYYAQFECKPVSIDDFKKNKNLFIKVKRKHKFCVTSQMFTPALMSETPRKTVDQL